MVESGVYNIYVNDGTKEVSRFELIEIAIGDPNQTTDAIIVTQCLDLINIQLVP